mmetsp:Transcript_6861/g.12917  ORF Transcript_6861/g.12917 Transcript_6861/m.12917 type:complete len:116 (-) Transcript_6861:3851-4198(-)
MHQLTTGKSTKVQLVLFASIVGTHPSVNLLNCKANTLIYVNRSTYQIWLLQMFICCAQSSSTNSRSLIKQSPGTSHPVKGQSRNLKTSLASSQYHLTKLWNSPSSTGTRGKAILL